MPNIAVVYHSGFGHTDVLAHEVVAGAGESGCDACAYRIEGAETYDEIIAAIDGADAVIFGSPTYMGNVSGPMKMFIDAGTKRFFAQAWRDKIAAGFTTSGSPSGDKLGTLMSLAIFAAQHGMIWVGTGTLPGGGSDTDAATDAENRLGGFLGAMAQSANASPEITPGTGDRATARALGRRVAGAALRWTGRPPLAASAHPKPDMR